MPPARTIDALTVSTLPNADASPSLVASLASAIPPEAALALLAALDLVPWFVAGLLLGSFANACIHRWPREMSVMRGRSHCPHCERLIGWRDNIPVLGWILLAGRCRSCRGPISLRYPFVELVTGLGFAACALSYPGTATPAAAAGLFWALTVAFWVDCDHRIIPDEVSFPALGAGLLLAWHLPLGIEDPIGAAVLYPVFGDQAFATAGAASLARAAAGAAAGGGLLGLLRWAGERVYGQEAMGLGDVKLLAAIGAWFGVAGVLYTLFGASILGASVSVVLLLRRKVGMRSAIPFGPFLVMGALLVAAWGIITR